MEEREHERLRSLIAPYVLGAVPPEEIAEVRSHLLSCDECMAAADDYAAVGDSLSLSAGPNEVPAGFSERLLTRVRTERANAATEGAPVSSGRRWSLLPALSVAALLLVTAVFGVSLYRNNQTLDRQRGALSRLLPGEGFRLHGTGALGAVVPDNDGSIFVAEGLTDLPSDRVYEIWLMEGDCDPANFGACEIRGVELFDASDGLTIVELDESLDGYSRAAVTIEPAGGSPQPTSDPVIDSAV